MLILITYDVSRVEKAGQHRLRRAARAWKDFGQRVLSSNARLDKRNGPPCAIEIKPDEDSLRFYYLDEKAVERIEHHGTEKAG